MTRIFRMLSVLTVAVLLTGAGALAESSGKDLYQEKCVGCHGSAGLANTGAGSVFKVKPVTDPEVRKMSQDEMLEIVREGKGRMQSWKRSLTDEQIRSEVTYFRTFLK